MNKLVLVVAIVICGAVLSLAQGKNIDLFQNNNTVYENCCPPFCDEFKLITKFKFYIKTNNKFLLPTTGETATKAPSVNNDEQNKGTIHKTFDRLNTVAEKVPGVVKSINDKIEVRVENVVHPKLPEGQQAGIVRSAVANTAQLVGTVGREVGGFASTVGKAAMNMTKNTASAITSSVRRSISRITGLNRRPVPVAPVAPATTTSSDSTTSTANAEPTVEAGSAPEELSKTSTVTAS